MKKKFLAIAFTLLSFMPSLLHAMANRPNADPNAPPPPAWVQYAPILFMVGVIYLFLLRPQSKQRKERDRLLGSVKRGDRVVTSGGLVVTIMNLGPEYVDVKLNEETRAKIQRSAIVSVLADNAVEKEEEPQIPQVVQ